MNFQQLRIVREAVRQQFNLTEVASVLCTSQSGVSKHIKDLEEELGTALFVRKGKRLLGLTEPGVELVAVVERILQEVTNLRTTAAHYVAEGVGELSIATTHTQARYSLPPIISQFRTLYPKVHLRLYQASPEEIVQRLRRGEVDIGIATEGINQVDGFASLPFYRWRHAVVAPCGHPLTHALEPDLTALARYPIITYHEGFTGRGKIERAFARAGLSPDICMSALDADVIKSYVELGLGVGIIAPMAFDPDRDQGLEMITTAPLFDENTTWIALQKGRLLRDYAYRFIHLCCPHMAADDIAQVVM